MDGLAPVSYIVLAADFADRLPLSELWGSAIGFVILMIAVVALIGATSGSLTVGAFGGYLTFIFFAVNAEIDLLLTLAYVTVAVVIIGTAFKIWRVEGVSVGG